MADNYQTVTSTFNEGKNSASCSRTIAVQMEKRNESNVLH
ncbi:hypothetical protein RUMHYD_00810 [Blautia hydrogenotrophica DSM 10507]|uniref:Uncharacterized protein n=1 Tax=Blautia hydrogenotrophica (strain DSM 10507 / JCM 14656 / S5a33) TaxID=476272 RepID=C0CIZ3_BLAHS|nr:hypothetical protein RUMHYD_00810 [Blautia hydrogenotrophica DSM 10507]